MFTYSWKVLPTHCWAFLITGLTQEHALLTLSIKTCTHPFETLSIPRLITTLIHEADVLNFEGRAYAQVGDVDSFWR